jgi:nucleoside-diphosphate-sugar epimerase
MDPVVVLGAGGFVGHAVCDALAAAGRPVVAVLRRAPERPLDCRTVGLDLLGSSPGALALELGALRPAAVVNAAGALWNVTDEQLVDGNVRLVDRVVDALTALPRPVRLVHIGSAYEYGAQPPGLPPPAETRACRPESRYARTKLAGTGLIAQTVAADRIDAVVLRIAVATGPYAPRGSLLGGIAHQLAGRPGELRLPPVAGVRDIVDVRDVADAVLAAIDARRVPPVVNIGSGIGFALTEVVDELIRIAAPGPALTIVRGPAPAVRRDAGVGEQPLDIGLACRSLGWVPAYSLTDALHGLWESTRSVNPLQRGQGGSARRRSTARSPFARSQVEKGSVNDLALDGERIHV